VEDSNVPKVDLENVKGYMDSMLNAIEGGLVRSCHDVDEGGLAVALAEMCIGGGMGAVIDVDVSIPPSIFLFNEGPTRWVVEATPDNAAELLETLGATPTTRLGVVCSGEKEDRLKAVVNGKLLLDAPVEELRKSWEDPLWEMVG